MRICIAGKNTIAVEVCKFIRNNYPNIPLCFIPNSTDTGENDFQPSFKKYCLQRGIPEVSLKDLYEWDDLIFLSMEFNRIVRPEKFVSKRLFNIHFSLLPQYKGMYTSAVTLRNGEKRVGVTFHYIDSGIDTGWIIDQTGFDVDENEIAYTLYRKYTLYGTQIVIKNLPDVIEGKEKGHPQPILGSSYYSKKSIDYSDLRLDTNQTAYNIDCQVRAYHFRNYQLPKFEDYTILYCKYTQDKSLEAPGTIVDKTDKYLRVATIDYDILLYVDRFAELMEAVRNNDIEKIKLEKDLSYYKEEKETTHGWTLLMVAAYLNHFEIVKVLINSGFSLNEVNYNGTTVAMYAKDGALKTKNTDSLFYIIEHGADLTAKDLNEKDLFDYLNGQDKELANIIRERYDTLFVS